MTAWSIDAVVIGAGVVGLAAARRLALAGLDTLVLEAADAIDCQLRANQFARNLDRRAAEEFCERHRR